MDDILEPQKQLLAEIYVGTDELDDLHGVRTYAVFKVTAYLYPERKSEIVAFIGEAAAEHYGSNRTEVLKVKEISRSGSAEKMMPTLQIRKDGLDKLADGA